MKLLFIAAMILTINVHADEMSKEQAIETINEVKAKPIITNTDIDKLKKAINSISGGWAKTQGI